MSRFAARLVLALSLALPGVALAQGTGTQLTTPGGDVYEVIPGDTLWDICSQFFGDPQYWPTLWSINNEEVSNPHYIYPGQRLRFQPGTDVRAPSVLMDVDVPDIAYEDSFKDIFQVAREERDCRLYIPFGSPGREPITVQAPAFLSRSAIEPLGRVDASAEGRKGLSLGDIVYMRFRNPGDVSCGDIYSTYSEIKEVRHPEVRSARLGKVYRVSSYVMVTDVGDKWVTGRVVQSYRDFPRGELLTDRIPVTGQVRQVQPSQDLDGFIIDKGHDENLLIQRNQVVFIDRGRADGVDSGATFWVVRRGDGLSVKKSQEDQTLPDRVIGRLVVFSADENVSTAVLTNQALDVRIGDRITARLD